MEFSVDINPANHCAIVGLDGPFVLPSLERACTRLINHPDWRSDFDIALVIRNETDFNEVTLDRLKEVQAFMGGWNAEHRSGPNPRTAIVCNDDFKRVMADLWLALVGNEWPIELGIFTSTQDALNWFARPANAAQT
ncbi:hypothetical protein [Maricaulis sp.]|uniref:hypothetical protein n=1 Tax=Maricaulis sp. TaxID=1486257 RepID=UPI003A90F86C